MMRIVHERSVSHPSLPHTEMENLEQLANQKQESKACCISKTNMEAVNRSSLNTKWRFRSNEELAEYTTATVRGVLTKITENLNPQGTTRSIIRLGNGDPAAFPCFRTTPLAEDAICEMVISAQFNGYAPNDGVLAARRAIAHYLSKDLPYELSPDDVYLTVGCAQAIETILAVLACPGANILLPRPGFPYYEGRAAFSNVEARHFDLLPEKDWEVNLDAVEALADENTVAMVIINPGNPCGNVFKYQHLKEAAETARKLGILVIADEVYGHLTFGSNPFVPMGVFGLIAPVITLGSVSKRWIVPGWCLGWLVTSDPCGILKEQGVVDSIKGCLTISSESATFVQGAIPQILEKTTQDFFSKIIGVLKEDAEICYSLIKEILPVTCPSKPEGFIFVMAKLDLSLLDGIKDDLDFCMKLANQESVIVVPGVAVGLKDWLRITFAVEPSSLRDGLQRIKAFCTRHAKKH